ncbi:MAG TPA: SgcJ/EcaC family oxidoreductase [Fimbriimonadaceae bacterium]|nr:SgcJ/EcaC family oxidoreductase [Fimbriimonadaceae bacterium]
MKKNVPMFVLAMAVLVGCGKPPAPMTTPEQTAAPATLTADDKAKIQATTDKFDAAFNAGDFEAAASCYTADAMVMPPNGPAVVGHDAIVNFGKSMPKVKDFSATVDEVHGMGDEAVVVGTYKATFIMPDGKSMDDHGKYIEIRKKQADGSWLMYRDIFNSDLPAEGPPPPTK